MHNSKKDIIEHISKLSGEAEKIAPSILRFDENGNYGSVTDEHLKHDEYLRWDIEVQALLKKLSEMYPSDQYYELYKKYNDNKSMRVHSKSIYVHMNLQLLKAALHFITSTNVPSLTSKINTQREPMKMDIFISHSSKDKDIAEQLIDILSHSLKLDSGDIRCTSVDGYRLPGGTKTEDQLKAEIHDCEILIGIITSYSLKSAYVLFELGARWGCNKPMKPLLAKGLNPEQLEGPIRGMNCLNCSNSSEIHQMIDEISSMLDIPKQPVSVYQNKIDSLVSYSNANINKTDLDSNKQNEIFSKGAYWKVNGENKEGPFCQVCKEKDNKLIRLSEDDVDEGNGHVIPTYFCRVCKNTYDRPVD